jgi:hypothetical protein
MGLQNTILLMGEGNNYKEIYMPIPISIKKQYIYECCGTYYGAFLKSKVDALPEVDCEVCGEQITPRKLRWYKNGKHRFESKNAKK